MRLQIGDAAPDFGARTTAGPIRFHEWMGGDWVILFSHPKDFTPVCTTELGYLAKLEPEFERRNVRLIGLSVDRVEDHRRWIEDIHDVTGHAPKYPIIEDPNLEVAKLYGMLDASATAEAGTRTAADNATVRNVFVIGPDKRIKVVIAYPMSTGRNFDELLRIVDSVQLTATHAVATPVNWQPGEDVIILPSVSDESARERYPAGWKWPKPYIRLVPCPAIGADAKD